MGPEAPQKDDVDAYAPPSTPPGAATPPTDAEAAFRAGYLDAGGSVALLDHFVLAVLPCESPDGAGGIEWTPGNADYRSAAQFHPQSWERVEREVGRSLAYEQPYDVGIAVATWVWLIGADSIATTSGWPWCGR
ncbi:MAG TPA: hypothetical protein VJB57_07115 [Dehalococcoidia bacterium]|nr:hypothetical protein [Dehalococcoidia bacterium]